MKILCSLCLAYMDYPSHLIRLHIDPFLLCVCVFVVTYPMSIDGIFYLGTDVCLCRIEVL